MMERELDILAELLGRDNPQVKAILWAARDLQKQGFAMNMLRALVRERGWNLDDLPRFPLPRDITPSDYVIGTAVSGDVLGDEIGPSSEDLDLHIGIFGMTNGGKTTLVKLLLVAFTKEKVNSENKRTFFIWDTDCEYLDLLPLYAPDQVIWLTADELGVNPLEVPKKASDKLVMPPDKWIDVLREVLRLLWLNEPSLNLFSELLHEEYVKRGIIGGSEGEWPYISDMIKILELLSFKSNSDEAKARSKLLNWLNDLRRALPGLDVASSRDIYRLFYERSVILDVSEVNDTSLPFLFAFITKLFGAIFHSDKPEIRRMEVIEEGHQVLGGHTDKRTSDIKESTASGILRDLRKSESCGIVVTHLPHDLEDAVLGNLGTVFCLRLGEGRSIDRAAQCINVERWQKPEIAQLPSRHAIARFSRYGKPVQLVIKDAARILSGSRPVSPEEARERSKPVLDAIPFLKRAPEQKEDDTQAEKKDLLDVPGGLPTKTRMVFARIAERPWELIADRMDALGLDRDSEGSARDQLERLGLIRKAGKVGGRHLLYELTKRGEEVAEKWA